MKNRLILTLLFCLFTFLLFAQSKQNERVLKVGVESDIDVLGPWESAFAVNAKIFWNILEPLVTFEEKSTKIKPNLATSWKVSNNNRTWIFKLNGAVKFHNGNSLIADDVVASASLFQDFKGKVEKVDRLTVRFILPEPHSGFLHTLVDITYGIAPSWNINEYKVLKKLDRLEDFIPIGSGPFKFSRWERGKKIILESFADYWQGAPWLKNVVYKVIPNNDERLSALEKGEIDVIDVVSPADLPRVRKNPNLRIISIYGMNICYIAMNTTHKPLDNIKVRRAINMAVDKKRLIIMFYYGGYGVPTNRVLSPAFWKFRLSSEPEIYRPAAAKKFLTEAGYDKSLSLKLLCIPIARPYLPDPKGVAEEIKRQLADIGVKVHLTIPPTYTDYDYLLRKGDYDLVLEGWIDVTGDPDYTLSSLLSGKESTYNDSHWHNQLFDEKLQAARELPISEIKARKRLYDEAQSIFQEEAPWIPLFHTKIFVIHNHRVKGIIFYPSSMLSYHKVRLEH